jgi:four helix bundle protein
MTQREMKDRTKKFALDIIKLCDGLPRSVSGGVIARQLVRSGTSIAANYRSACRGRSRAEFLSKIGVSEEEADETGLWLELLRDSGLATDHTVDRLLGEVEALTRILAATYISTKRGHRNL